MKITRKSMYSGKENTMDLPTVTQERLEQCWSQNASREGKHIQEVFPELSADEREFLMTGSTPEEWEEMFGGGDDE
jgi:hypothetical protein